MNKVRESTLLKYWNQPDRVCQYSVPEWELFLRQARFTRLAAQWAYRLAQQEQFDQIPEPAQAALDACWTYAEHHQRTINWEIRQVGRVLQNLDCPRILLKGAAYIHCQMDFALGRLISDMDILVPKSHINQAEQILLNSGWITGTFNPYDQRYYRQWMHELPPMVNTTRGTTLDMHHNILPESSRRSIEVSPMIAQAVPLFESTQTDSEDKGWYILQDVDMVLHSAVHTFQEGEIAGSLRDIVDIDGLLRQYSQNSPDFWERLIDRAKQFKLERPLYYGVHFAHEILDTPIEPEIQKQFHRMSPGYITGHIMDSLAFRVLNPPTFAPASRFTGAAALFLYARSHYGRMPLKLLIPHLWHKTFPHDPLPEPDNDGQPIG